MILLSSGHYPAKPGSCYQGFCEHDEANRWVDVIYGELGFMNALRVPTGRLSKKVDFINAHNPTIAIEIHFNSLVSKDGVNVGDGSLTLYYPGSEKGKVLAMVLQDAIEPIFGKHWQGVMEGYYKMSKDNGPDYFLAKTKCPSVILEPSFIHLQELITSKRKEACLALAKALQSGIPNLLKIVGD